MESTKLKPSEVTKKTEVLHIRVELPIAYAVRARAAAEDRTVSNYIARLIAAAVQEKK